MDAEQRARGLLRDHVIAGFCITGAALEAAIAAALRQARAEAIRETVAAMQGDVDAAIDLAIATCAEIADDIDKTTAAAIRCYGELEKTAPSRALSPAPEADHG